MYIRLEKPLVRPCDLCKLKSVCLIYSMLQRFVSSIRIMSSSSSSSLSAHARLSAAGYDTLPPVVKPVAAYTSWARDGDVLYVSGQLPMSEGKLVMSGQVTDESVPSAAEAAQVCALNALAVMEDAVGLDNVDRVLKVTGFVKADASFNSPHLVVNGCSQFLGKIFDEPHARSAVVVASLPLDAAVEIDFIVKVKSTDQ
jgi:enamine deaminase RidA (YjgF/YER057c/UK114 family)